MVIDTSAIPAILEDEPECHRFNALVASTPARRISHWMPMPLTERESILRASTTATVFPMPSRVSGEPLLYKGGDFAQADIVPAD